MKERRAAPFGSWSSPVGADLVAGASIGLSQIVLDGQDVYWIESRPLEGGRNVIVRATSGGGIRDIIPPPFNARTRVHEYGGGAYTVHRGTVFFTNFTDQLLYRVAAGAAPRALTSETRFRHADMIVDDARGRLLAVREDHTVAGREAVNSLAAVDIEGGGESVLVSGNDFYSSPRMNADGSRLAWLTWNHPNMPWDGTELWIAEVARDGSLVRPRRVAGGLEESIFQPEWCPDGTLAFVSDRTGWWNLYRRREDRIEPLWPKEAEFGAPQWVFGMSKYAFQSPRRLVCAYTRHGVWGMARLDTATGRAEELDLSYTSIESVRTVAERVLFVGGSPVEPDSIVSLDLTTKRATVLRSSLFASLDARLFSLPRPVEFPTEQGRTAHGLFYPPQSAEFEGPSGERPPLIVSIHGGPTAAATSTLRLGVQFWTSRGFAVLDVNYGGSTGYGREYRKRLEGLWGVVDVDDCVNGALHMAREGAADEKRLVIHGGSAGGYTTLCALTFRDSFKAGASYFGLSDLTIFAGDTHKFESRYLERLVGPYPQRKDLYEERSPIRYVDRLSCPVIFFQGLDDKVVPPNQAELMVEALRRKGLPVAYVAFEGEQHGFRKAESLRRMFEGELYFYSRVFGFALSEPVEPVEIWNL